MKQARIPTERAEDAADPASPKPDESPPATTESFAPALLRPRRDGWTADRQRRFLTILAETGCVSIACDELGISTRSAYRLRAHPQGRRFSIAWDQALFAATGRLTAIAFDRAINGNIREMWKNGELVGEVREPSDKLLTFLLAHFARHRFGPVSATNAFGDDAPGRARDWLPGALDRLVDADVATDPLGVEDQLSVAPDARPLA